MKIFPKIVDSISQFFAIISGIFILLAVSIVIIEVALRTFFHSTIYISEEYTAYLLVAISFFSLAYTLKEDGHIRVRFLYDAVKGTKARNYLNLIAFTAGLIVFSVVTVVTFNLFWDSVLLGSQSLQISRTYLAIPQFAMPLGSFILTLQFGAEVCKTIHAMRNRKDQKIDTRQEFNNESI